MLEPAGRPKKTAQRGPGGEYTVNFPFTGQPLGPMSVTPQTATIPDESAGLRLDRALARMFPDYSRSRLKDWLTHGHITVDGETRRPRDLVRGGERVVLEPQAEIAVSSCPEAIDLDLVHEDDHLLVINKPAGLVVHPGAGNLRGTLMNGLLYRAPELAELPRAGIIHRLDKDTSGLMLVARSLPAHNRLTQMLAARDISRHYEAVCLGVLTAGGTIDAPIRRHPVDRLRMAVHDNGKPAVTHYTVRQRYAAHSHVDIRLESGRTHQIRVHFAWRRHPLVGDPVYGGRLAIPAGADDELVAYLRGFRRQALCATRLTLVHPISAAPLDFMVEPPRDFLELLRLLAAHAAAARTAR